MGGGACEGDGRGRMGDRHGLNDLLWLSLKTDVRTHTHTHMHKTQTPQTTLLIHPVSLASRYDDKHGTQHKERGTGS